MAGFLIFTILAIISPPSCLR